MHIGERLQIREVDWSVQAVFPPGGRLTAQTRIYCDPPLSALNEITKIHVLPVQASLGERKLTETEIFEALRHKITEGEYFSEHETFVIGAPWLSTPTQFHVIACEPPNGHITNDTELFTQGVPIDDVKRLHVLPFKDTMSDEFKQHDQHPQLDEDGLFEHFLQPYFLGRHRLLHTGQHFDVFGSKFKVVGAEPASGGLVTNNTVIHAQGEWLSLVEEQKREQEAKDEEMARQLQAQEQAEIRQMVHPGGGLGGQGGEVPAEGAQAELAMRLHRLMAVIPPDDPHRALVQRLFVHNMTGTTNMLTSQFFCLPVKLDLIDM